MKREEGFTLVELMITMVVFVLVIAAASQVFSVLVNQFKQQNRMAETHIEGAVGLSILRRDLEHAGYGLPWNLNGATYSEAEVDNSTAWVDRDLNDGPPNNPARGTDLGDPASNPPGAIRSLNNDVSSFNHSDVIAIKSSNVDVNAQSQAWTTLGLGDVKTNGLSGESFADTDRVMVISPGSTDANRRSLVMVGAQWHTTYNATANYAPANPGETNVIYGIKPQGNPVVEPRMPFNRADYYIRRPNAMPPRCAPNTGILYKSMLKQSDGTHTEYPIFDCVADMQVVYNMNGVWMDDTSNYTAKDLRDQLKEVRVYILSHEGQKDFTYTHIGDITPTTIRVGDTAVGGWHAFNIGTNVNYRWRLYNLVVQPSNLR